MTILKTEQSQKFTSWLLPILIAFVIVFLIKTFLFAPFIVNGESMEPTLSTDERLVVNKTTSFFSKINRGDIIVIKNDSEDKYYVKRVIGLPNDQMEVKNDQLFINNALIEEPYLKENKQIVDKLGIPLTENIDPFKVPADYYYVMGDNRQKSMDSRNGLGLIHKDEIVGKSECVFYPISNMRLTK